MQLSVGDVAQLLSVSEKTVYRWVQQGKLPVSTLDPAGSLLMVTQLDVQASNTDLEIGGSVAATQYADANQLGNVDSVQVTVDLETLLRDGFE